jgi:hypothetical protein
LVEDLDLVLEREARRICAKLLGSKYAREQGDKAVALVMLSFAMGAAWALNEPRAIELAEAQMESIGKRTQ